MNINPGDLLLLDYPTYRDYLRSFITVEDCRYLVNDRVRRSIVRLGYRSVNPVYDENEFVTRRDTVAELINPKISATIIFSDFSSSIDPVLQALKLREKANVQKDLSTIIYLKHRTKGGFEISGYIDYGSSLHLCNLSIKGATDWMAVFQEQKMLRPLPTDLSYYHAHKNIMNWNDSDNYKIIHDKKNGLSFMHRGDHKVIHVGPHHYSNVNVARKMVFSEKYGYVVFYDHEVRKKI